VNLGSSSMELTGALKDLRRRWEETREVWNDPVSQDFQKNQWELLEMRVIGAIRAMERLAPVLEKLSRECG
jgi:hypothetical protein